MPITQDRLLALVSGAKTINEAMRGIRKLLHDNSGLLSDANSVAERTEDKIAREVILSLIGTQRAILEITSELGDAHADLIALIGIEERHFQTAQKRNVKAAQYQRQLRLRKKSGATIRNYEHETNVGETPTWKPDIAGAAKAHEEARAKPRHYDKSVLSTSVPSLDEQNKEGIVPSSEDVL